MIKNFLFEEGMYKHLFSGEFAKDKVNRAAQHLENKGVHSQIQKILINGFPAYKLIINPQDYSRLANLSASHVKENQKRKSAFSVSHIKYHDNMSHRQSLTLLATG